jgi:hypothetical protein
MGASTRQPRQRLAGDGAISRCPRRAPSDQARINVLIVALTSEVGEPYRHSRCLSGRSRQQCLL